MTVKTMTLNKARAVGERKLNVQRELFQKCFETAKKIDGMRAQDVPVMTLALAVLGSSNVRDMSEIESELTDALALIAKAEREYNLEMSNALKAGQLH